MQHVIRMLGLAAGLTMAACAFGLGDDGFTETFDQQVVGTRLLALHTGGAWASEPMYSNATNALGHYGLATNIYLNSYNPGRWTTNGLVVARYRVCHLPCSDPGVIASSNAYGTGQWEFIVHWTDQSTNDGGGIFLHARDGTEGAGWIVSGAWARALCYAGSVSSSTAWIPAQHLTSNRVCIAFDWRAARLRVFNGEGVFAEFTNGIPQQDLRAIIRGSAGPPDATCSVYRVAYGARLRPYALDDHVYFNGRAIAANNEYVNPTLWVFDAGTGICSMAWNYSNNQRYLEFTGNPTIARIPRHGPYGPATEYAVMALQYRFNNLAHSFIGLARDGYTTSLSNRVGFLSESGTLYAYSSGPATIEKTPLGADWSGYITGVWCDFTLEWHPGAINFYVDGNLLVTHSNAAAFPDPALLRPTFESRANPHAQLAGLRFCATLAESQTIIADRFDQTYGKYWVVVQDDFESNSYNSAGDWTGYTPRAKDGIPEVYPEIEPVTDSVHSNALMFKTRSAGGSMQNAHADLLGLTRRGNVTPFGVSPITFVRFYFKVDRHWTFHYTRESNDPLTVWQDGNKYMKSGTYLAQQANLIWIVLGNPRVSGREIAFGIGDPQYSQFVRGMRIYGHTQAIAASGTNCAFFDVVSRPSWVAGAQDLWRAHYPNRKAAGAPLLSGSWQEGHEEHRVNMADYNLFWHGTFYGGRTNAEVVLCDETQMNGGAMRGGYAPLMRDVWYYMELEIRSTKGTNNGIGLYLGRADDPTTDDAYYAPDLYFTTSESTRPAAAYFGYDEDRVNGGRDKWSGIEVGPLLNQFQFMKGVYLSDLVISKSKVGNTWAAAIAKPVWHTAAAIAISNNPVRLDYRNRTVTLALHCPGATGMIIHHTRMPAGISRWTNFATSATWTLPYVCGTVAVYATFRNGAGLETTAVTASTYLDIPPTLYANVHTNRMALNTPDGPLAAGPYQMTWLTENIVDDEPIAGISFHAFYTATWHVIAAGLPNDGAYTWPVPALATTESNAHLRIIVDDSFGHSVTGTTAVFSILPEPAALLQALMVSIAAGYLRAGKQTNNAGAPARDKRTVSDPSSSVNGGIARE